MAITDVNLKGELTKASKGVGATNNALREVYDVISDTAYEDLSNVLSAAGLPTPGTTVASHTNNAICVILEAELHKDDTHNWRVTASYGAPPNGDDLTYPPTSRPAILSRDSNQIQIPIYTDVSSGDPILLPNGRPFSEPITRLTSNPLFTITRYEDTDTITNLISDQLTYENHVNSATFYGLAANTVLCKKITGKQEYHNNGSGVNTAYELMTYSFEYNPLGWNPTEYLAMDIYESYEDPDTGDVLIRRIKDMFGVDVKSPVFLDSNGVHIPEHDILYGLQTPHLVEVQQYDAVDFTNLSF